MQIRNIIEKTYIAGAWDEDYDAIMQLYYWNKNDIFLLEFSNIHDFVHSKDSSLACSIKQSLSKRMDRCKYFVLIVGPKTNIGKKGNACIAVIIIPQARIVIV